MTPIKCPLLTSGFDQRHNTSCCHVKLLSRPKDANAYFQSPEYKSIVADFNNGIKSSYCNVCWEMENSGGVSKRLVTLRREKERSLYSDEQGVVYLTLFIGNKCNLFCRTCHSYSSTGFIKEENWINNNYSFNHHITPPTTFDEQQLDFDISKIKYIEVLGGEPLYDTSHFSYIDKFINQGLSKNIEITYATNTTMPLTEEIRKRFKHFQKVNLMLSIDAVGKEFEFIRTGGNWQNTQKNINDYKKFIDEINGFITLHPTISILNCMSLPELYEYFKRLNIYEGNIIFVDKPEHYSLSAIPDYAKDTIIQNISYGKKTETIKNRILESKFDPNLFNRFLQYMEITKRFRGLDFAEYLPKLKKVLKV